MNHAGYWSESEVAAGGGGQGVEGPEVAVEQDGEVFVPGLGGDPVEVDSGGVGGGGVAGAQRVAGDPGGGQAGGLGAFVQDAGERVGCQPVVADLLVAEPDEQWARCLATQVPPGDEFADRVGGGTAPVGNADQGAGCVLVGLGAADVQQQAAGLGFDAGQGEGGELADPQRRGVAEQDQRGVAGTQQAAAVDRGEDLRNLGPRSAAGLGAEGRCRRCGAARRGPGGRCRGRSGSPGHGYGGRTRWHSTPRRGWPPRCRLRRVRSDRRRPRPGRRAAGRSPRAWHQRCHWDQQWR